MCVNQEVIVSLTSETVDVLCTLVEQDEFGSTSNTVRSVLDSYVSECLVQNVRSTSEINDALNIEDLTINGSSPDSAVRAAAREFIRKRINLGERQWGM